MAHNEIGKFFMVRMHGANEKLKHRGPDVGKLYNNDFVGIGHRRLSVIDLSAEAVQPFWDVSQRYGIVFNGEIFNFKELKNELSAKGVQFRTTSDTEVLLYTFIEYGEKCLEKLNGFFSFCIYDEQEDSFFIARDRYGIKPLVYFADDDKFIFSSEISSLCAYNLPKEIDADALYLYLQLHYIPAPRTIYKNIYKLPTGSFLRIKRGEKHNIKKFYEIPYSQSTSTVSYEDAQKKLLELLEDSVRLRLVSDVPIGAFLSGGIDSSAITAFASRHTKHLNTFSIGYKNEPFYDETKYAQIVAKKFGTNHTVFSLGNDEIFEAALGVLPSLGEPFADPSAIPLYALCAHARKHVTVALSGDGGDELFGGYNKYLGDFKVRSGASVVNWLKRFGFLLDFFPQSRSSSFSNKIRQAKRLLDASKLGDAERYWFLSCIVPEKTAFSSLKGVFAEKISKEAHENFKNEITKHFAKNDLNEVLLSDCKMVLPDDMLHKADSMSMAHALELRVPFLDYRLVNFAFSLPAEYKVSEHGLKRVLKDSLRGILPEEIFSHPKHGFDVPLLKGFRTVLRPMIEEYFNDEFVREQGIFSPEYVRTLKESVFGSAYYDQNQVWALLVFQYWWKNFHQEEPPKLQGLFGMPM
jgi:asparagine synthase (glutamine-hydrolysing)